LFETQVLQAATELIVTSDVYKISIQSECLQHSRVHPECDRRVSLFDTAQRLSRYTRPLSDRFGGICPP
jgi:hypothetical protein